jgi:protein-L-isoaspartate O-methyltransferase
MTAREATMQAHTLAERQKPRTDDRPLWDLIAAARGYTALLIAHDLKLFPLLGERPRPLTDICQTLALAPHPVEALLITLEALGLVRSQNGHYGLTSLAEDALLESSPTYFGWYLDREIANESVFSFASMNEAVRTDSPLQQRGDRVMFARAMHSMSMGAALAWPQAIDLSGHRVLLDIGGGSGAHSIGAALRWPHLDVVLFDKDPEVLRTAEEFIARHSVQERVRLHIGDMLNDPLPPADVHLFSAIYHHWPPERCHLLTDKSYGSLTSGGRIIIHERLFNDTRNGPFPVVALNLLALLRGEGGRYSARAYTEMLQQAGFTDIEVKPTVGYWSIVTGRKA